MKGPRLSRKPAAVPRKSESFELLIDKAPGSRGKRYKVWLIRSPAGEAPADTQHSFGEKDLKRVWRDLRPEGSTQTTPEEIGSELFRALISGEIQRQWDKSLAIVRSQKKGLQLLIRLGKVPELEGWPWELLYDRSHGGFLALSGEISVVRYLENPTWRRTTTALPLRILVVVANPADCGRIDGDGEWDRLNRALKRLTADGKVRMERLSPPTLPALEKAMSRSWNIVHFVGHGRFEDGEGSLVLEDGEGGRHEVPGRTLKVLLQRQKNLRLAVLNSCVGAKTSSEDVFAGVAQSLVMGGIPAVVAMRSRISDRAALTFAERFYESLAKALPVDAALGEARQAMYVGGEDLEWSTPVLYMRSAGSVITENLWRALLAAALGAAALAAGTYRVSTLPDRSSDPACPSPPGLDVSFVKIEPEPDRPFAMGTKGLRLVKITHPYCLGKFEVTQSEWKKIMGPPPKQAKEGDDLPVGDVSWNEAEAFLSRLAAKEPAAHYRQATEAEWEYAVRAGTPSRFTFGSDASELRKYGNCHKTGEPTQVGRFQPNPWGLYDMYGNVAEWVADWYGPLSDGSVIDPTGPATGTEKVRRGGSFSYHDDCDSSVRKGSKPDLRRPDTGFRIVRDPVP
ncbi:MAG TPA: CHAT domain-containing protein [Thermoanaerobaculia bacterium]|nr:CHAT domain-containing protein [Thermoanaerobaculia bacterium]